LVTKFLVVNTLLTGWERKRSQISRSCFFKAKRWIYGSKRSLWGG